jgi:hypothetical protein
MARTIVGTVASDKSDTLSKVLEHANVGFEEKDATADVPEEEPKAESSKPKVAASKLSAKATKGSGE